MGEGKDYKSEEDKLLDPIAKSILRDLEARADDEHVNQEHMNPQTTGPINISLDNGQITITLDNGQVIKCDDTELTWNERVHCNMALEQDGNDADGLQGGQSWGVVLDTPLTVIIDGGVLVVILDDGTMIRCDDEDLTENEIIHCNMALERNPLLGRNVDGTPITGRYDDEGNPDPNGRRDSDGDLIEGQNPDGTPIQVGPAPDGNEGTLGGDGNATDGDPDGDAAPGSSGGDGDAADGDPSRDGDAAGSFAGGGSSVVQGGGYDAECNPDPEGEYDADCNYIGGKHDAEGNRDPDGQYDANGNYIGGRYDADCNPDPEGEYDADCNYIGGRYDADGNRDPDGQYDADGNYIGGRYDANCNPNPNGQYDENCNYIGGRYDEDGNPDPNGLHDENGALIYRPLSPSSSPVAPSPTVDRWRGYDPTVSPRPTGGPSYHPTLHGDPWVLRGTIYYDRNANGVRDSNVDTAEFGDDVEFSYGLGGVTVRLMECDPETNEGLASSEFYGTGENSYASTVSQGYDVLMHARLVGQEENGGKFNLIDIKVDRAYYIYVTAPGGYLLSGGVCNDNVPGWECTYMTPGRGRMLRGDIDIDPAVSLRRSLNAAPLPNAHTPPSLLDAYTLPSAAELERGVYEGRSEKCVRVDRFGMPESHLNLGVMRIGDIAFEDTDVELSLDLIEPEVDARRRGRRSLLDAMQERILQQDLAKGQNHDGTFVLLPKDKEAIGIIAAEVLASTLDKSLPKDVVLHSVSPINVIYFAPEPKELENVNDIENSAVPDAAIVPTREEMDAARDAPAQKSRPKTGGKLSVSVLVKGHHNRKDVGLDFDYIVQDFIRHDSETIREGLSSFNANCRNQVSKVMDLGYTVDDFLEVHSGKGVDLSKYRLNQRQQEEMEREVDPQAFSSACHQKMELPAYFEASLDGLKLRAKTDARFHNTPGGGSSAWPIIGFALLGVLAVIIPALCMGCFLYARGQKKRHQMAKEADVTRGIRPIERSGMGKSTERFNKGMDWDMMDEKLRINGETNKSPTMVAAPVPRAERKDIVGRLQRELSNMRLAVEDERKRRRILGAQRSDTRETARQDSLESGQSVQSGVTGLKARTQNNLTDGNEVKDGSAPAMETSNAPEGGARANGAKEVMVVNFYDEATEGPKPLSEVVARIHTGRRNRVNELDERAARRKEREEDFKSHTSLNIGNPIPKVINRRKRGTLSIVGSLVSKMTSVANSGSSSDDDDSSDSPSDSSSSSSEDELEAPSQLKARKQRGRRGTSGKKRKDKKRRKETKPMRSRKATKNVRMKNRSDVGQTGHSLQDRGGALAKPGRDSTAGHRRRTAGDEETKHALKKPGRDSTAGHRRRTAGDAETKSALAKPSRDSTPGHRRRTAEDAETKSALAKPGRDSTAGHRRRTTGDAETKSVLAKPGRDSTAGHRRRTAEDEETKFNCVSHSPPSCLPASSPPPEMYESFNSEYWDNPLVADDSVCTDAQSSRSVGGIWQNLV